MAIIVKTPVKKTKDQLDKELKKFIKPNRNPEKATEELFGLWEEKKTTLKEIREKNNRYNGCRC